MEHPKALEFLCSVRDLYQIPPENTLALGDLLDLFHFSKYPKGADFPITPVQEIEMAREKIKLWQREFPILKICLANHEERLQKRVSEADLPSSVVRSIAEIFQYPKDWEIRECFVPNTKNPFVALHGDSNGQSSITLTNNPRQFGMSCVFGHFHSLASIMHVNTLTLDMWSFNAGCLIDETSFAFSYGNKAKFKPSIGCGVILDEGRTPIWLPLT